jgi:hypothetical protein
MQIRIRIQQLKLMRIRIRNPEKITFYFMFLEHDHRATARLAISMKNVNIFCTRKEGWESSWASSGWSTGSTSIELVLKVSIEGA